MSIVGTLFYWRIILSQFNTTRNFLFATSSPCPLHFAQMASAHALPFHSLFHCLTPNMSKIQAVPTQEELDNLQVNLLTVVAARTEQDGATNETEAAPDDSGTKLNRGSSGQEESESSGVVLDSSALDKLEQNDDDKDDDSSSSKSVLCNPYETKPGYRNDLAFAKFAVFPVCKLYEKTYSENSSSSDEDEEDDPFLKDACLFALLLRVSPPPADKKKEFSYTRNIRSKKFKSVGSNYKRSFLFGDLADINCATFCLLERNNEDTNRHWARDLSTSGIKVGERLLIFNPRITGILNSGAYLIETDHPIELLSRPEVPVRPLNSLTAKHQLKYFVMKNISLKASRTVPPILWQTRCNSYTCDRHQFGKSVNSICACFNQSSRNDLTNRNTVLKISFSFCDGNGTKVRIAGYTSLRTSRFFFEEERVHIDTQQKNIPGVDNLIRLKYKELIKTVNNSGGWTIAGWFLRAQQEDEEAEQPDDAVLFSNVKINITYLYPSTLTHNMVSDEVLILSSEISQLQRLEDDRRNMHLLEEGSYNL